MPASQSMTLSELMSSPLDACAFALWQLSNVSSPYFFS